MKTYKDLREMIDALTADLVKADKLTESTAKELHSAALDYDNLNDAAMSRGHKFPNADSYVVSFMSDSDGIDVDEQELKYIAMEFICSEIRFILFPFK